jgi:hypothetical protein
VCAHGRARPQVIAYLKKYVEAEEEEEEGKEEAAAPAAEPAAGMKLLVKKKDDDLDTWFGGRWARARVVVVAVVVLRGLSKGVRARGDETVRRPAAAQGSFCEGWPGGSLSAGVAGAQAVRASEPAVCCAQGQEGQGCQEGGPQGGVSHGAEVREQGGARGQRRSAGRRAACGCGQPSPLPGACQQPYPLPVGTPSANPCPHLPACRSSTTPLTR